MRVLCPPAHFAKLHETVEIARRLASLEMAVGGRAKP